MRKGDTGRSEFGLAVNGEKLGVGISARKKKMKVLELPAVMLAGEKTIGREVFRRGGNSVTPGGGAPCWEEKKALGSHICARSSQNGRGEKGKGGLYLGT